MKLGHVVQWGNPEEGGNGDDTNCIVSATSFEEAIKTAEQHFQDFHKTYMNGKCQIVHELGQDNRPDGAAVIIIHRWIQCSANIAKMPYWHRNETTDIWERYDD